MIHLTGDIHGFSGAHRLFYGYDPYLHKIKEGDYLIVLGDFGLIWNQKENLNEKYFLDEINKRPWITLFIEGNHENFDRIWSDEFETIEFGGHYAKKIRDKILYLQRSCIYEIEGKKFLTIGGADSIDKKYRKAGISWWKQEKIMPSDITAAEQALAEHNNTVDYVLTHTCPHKVLKYCFPDSPEAYPDPSGRRLNKIMRIAKFKRWYFAHLHLNIKQDEEHPKFPYNFEGLYENIIPLGGEIEK